MPAVVPFIPLIAGGVAAGASIYGSRAQSGAMRDAGRIENASTAQALAYQREQDAYERQRDEQRYADEQRRYEESRGRSDEDRAWERGRYAEERDYGRGQYANYLGRLEPFSAAGKAVLPGLTQHVGKGVTRAIPTNAGGQGMVTLKAPTGAIREVPASQADYYIAQGAQRVG